MKWKIAAVLMWILGCGFALALPPEDGGNGIEPEVTIYREIGGQALQVHVFRPDLKDNTGPTAAIVLFHGGGWVVGGPEWTDPTAQRFAQLGIVAVSVEYRLSNDAITPVDALDDTRAIFRWVRTHAKELNIDPDRVAGYGVSAGGHLVAAAATIPCGKADAGGSDARPDLLLLWSPALDVARDGWFRKLLQGHGDASDYSPVEHAGVGTPPTCVVHGEKDTLTPLSGVNRFRDQVIKAGGICELHVYEGVGHLLTRNLENQEDDFDPDPEKRADGIAKHEHFLRTHGYIH